MGQAQPPSEEGLPLSQRSGKDISPDRRIFFYDCSKESQSNHNPRAHYVLNIQAAIEQTTPGSLASRLILVYSKKAKQILHERETPLEEERERGRGPDREKKKRLFQNTQALEEIKRLWEGGQHNRAEIARQIGYNRGTVFDNINE